VPDFESPFDRCRDNVTFEPAVAASPCVSLRSHLADLGVRDDNIPAHLAFVAANPSIDIKTYPASFAG
jgi:hypothetical protein